MTMTAFKRDYEGSMKCFPEYQRIVGPYLLKPASLEADLEQATDMDVISAGNIRISCRTRDPEYKHWWNEFTVRTERPTGAMTEHEKVCNGWGDWHLYGFRKEKGGVEIDLWTLLDWNAWRKHLEQSEKGEAYIKPCRCSNPDGTKFNAYKIAQFDREPRIVIASSLVPAPESDPYRNYPPLNEVLAVYRSSTLGEVVARLKVPITGGALGKVGTLDDLKSAPQPDQSSGETFYEKLMRLKGKAG